MPSLTRRPQTGWRATGWRACADLHTPEVSGVPRWFRCQKCNGLVTHGMVHQGGCRCGYRRLHGAQVLSWSEVLRLKLGCYPLTPAERRAVRPVFAR